MMDWLFELMNLGGGGAGVGDTFSSLAGGAESGNMLDPLGLMGMLTGGSGDGKSGAPALRQVMLQNAARPFIAKSLGQPDEAPGLAGRRGLGGY